MLYTGCHFKKTGDCERLNISRGIPKNSLIDGNVEELKPTWNMLKMQKEEYDQNYSKILENAEKNGVIKNLIEKAKTKNIVLLCWEHTRDNCHRLAVAQYIEKKYNIEVNEWMLEQKNKEKNKEEDEEKKGLSQGILF